MNLKSFDLSVDLLDVHAVSAAFVSVHTDNNTLR